MSIRWFWWRDVNLAKVLMGNNRANIRQELINVLGNSGSDCGERIYSNRRHNVSTSKLPCAIIYDEQESATPRDLRSVQFLRTVTTKIEILVSNNTDATSDLDTIASDFEDAISANRSLSGQCLSANYVGTELTTDESGEFVIGKAILTYEIKYLA